MTQTTLTQPPILPPQLELDTPHVPQLTLQYGGLRFRPEKTLLSRVQVDDWTLDLSSGVLLLGTQAYETLPEQRRLAFTEPLRAAIMTQLPALQDQMYAQMAGQSLPNRRRERLPLRAAALCHDLIWTALHISGKLRHLQARSWKWKTPAQTRTLEFWRDLARTDALKHHSRLERPTAYTSEQILSIYSERQLRHFAAQQISVMLSVPAEHSTLAMWTPSIPQLDFNTLRSQVPEVTLSATDLDLLLLQVAGACREPATLALSAAEIKQLAPRLTGSALLSGVSPWLRPGLLQYCWSAPHNPSGLQFVPAGPERDAFALVGNGDHNLKVLAVITAQRPEELVDLSFARALSRTLRRPEQLIEAGSDSAEHAVDISFELRDSEHMPAEVFTAAAEWRIGRRAQMDEEELAQRAAALSGAGPWNSNLLIPGLVSHERRLEQLRAERDERRRTQEQLLIAHGFTPDLARMTVSQVSFPPEAPTGTPGWDADIQLGAHLVQARVLRHVGALREESAEMDHCIGYGGYTDRCVQGVSRAVRFEGGPVRFTLLLSQKWQREGPAGPEAPVTWMASEYKRAGNEPLRVEDLQALRAYLGLVGVSNEITVPWPARVRAPGTRLNVPATELTAEQQRLAQQLLGGAPAPRTAQAVRAQSRVTERTLQAAPALAEQYARRLRDMTGVEQVLVMADATDDTEGLRFSHGFQSYRIPDLSSWDPTRPFILLSYVSEYVSDYHAVLLGPLPQVTVPLPASMELAAEQFMLYGLRISRHGQKSKNIERFVSMQFRSLRPVLEALISAKSGLTHRNVLS